MSVFPVLFWLRRARLDAQKLGTSFIGAQMSLLFGAKEGSFEVNGAGRLTVRKDSSDVDVFRQVWVSGSYDLDRFPQGARVRETYEQILRDGKVPIIIDAGANIGAAAAWFARQYPKAHIFAVEPHPDNAAQCRRNVEALGGKVDVIEAAIGGKPGFVRVDSPPPMEAWAVQTERTADASEAGGVKVVTIEDLRHMDEHGVLFIVKIDIEGFESDLFSGDLSWLEEAAAVMIEPHDWMLPGRGSSHGFQQAFGQRDFEVLISDENLLYVRH